MCGICGWLAFDRDLGVGDGPQELARMLATMSNRGPDDEGTWTNGPVALGHSRLAIIDIEGGRQPMTLEEEDGSALVLVYSGETYNYRELRGRLISAGHRFCTNSDTEVVLHAHREWGHRDPRNAVNEINGMFAYALWNARKRELLLVRDRLGIKPLYYYPTMSGVLFGSEPKAILANRLAKPIVDADGLRRIFGRVANPHNAVIRGMREVPPGHVVRVTREGIQQLTYWQLTGREHTDDLPTTVRHVRDLIEDTIRGQLVSDVPVCTLLSGGLDSSSLSAIAARVSSEQVRTFAVDFVGYSENFIPSSASPSPDRPYVHDVAGFVHTDHRDITLSTKELMDADVQSSARRALDLPISWGDVDSSLYLLFRAIRQHATVALSGESADEVFGGYRTFHDLECIRANTFPWLADWERTRGDLGPHYLAPTLLKNLDLKGYIDDQYRTALSEVPPPIGPGSTDIHERRMREVCYLFLTRFLPNLLDRKDRLSMAVGLEVRVPYCDHRIVEYVFNTPWSQKTFDGREKSLLRAASADLLPQTVLQRGKSPYPTTQDPTYDEMLRTQFKALLDNPNAAVTPLLAPGGIAGALSATSDRTSVERNWQKRQDMARILALESFLTRYKVSLEI